MFDSLGTVWDWVKKAAGSSAVVKSVSGLVTNRFKKLNLLFSEVVETFGSVSLCCNGIAMAKQNSRRTKNSRGQKLTKSEVSQLSTAR